MGDPRGMVLRDVGSRPSEAFRTGQPCPKTHAANLPGVIAHHEDGDFACAGCGHDLGVRGCGGGCCKQRFASDFFEDDPCAVGGDVQHGCCYHDAKEEPDG